ncbi:MAG: glycosyltransferase family 2 protein, partial [Spartobacteria bacterium]|nr:glycosyltransferase family 2 protein [Spartobacteria bacterium]
MSKDVLDFSVIILTCNRVERCLDSVAHNAARLAGHTAEIIIVNNGTQPVPVQSEIAGISVRVLQMSRNLGAEARNAGLAVAVGRYVVFVDDDAYLPDGFAVDTWPLFARHDGVAGISFRVHDAQGGEESCLLPSVFHGCACAFERAWLDRVGGYPVGYRYYGEEYDLAFQLYARGGRLILAHGVGAVRHIRDASGRNKERIIRLLLRNNTYTWCRFLPPGLIGPAIRDTLLRYRLVARKEGAERGLRQGCIQLPYHILRGLLHRRPLPPAVCERVLLTGHLRSVFSRLPAAGTDIFLCGVGKFPSIWRKEIQARGYTVRGYADFNTCWKGRRLAGVPVVVPSPDAPPAALEGATCF